MTGIVFLLFLAQAPSAQVVSPIAVVVSSKRPGADPFSANAAVRVHAALIREGVAANDALDDVATGKKVKAAGFSDARNCQGGASCLMKLAVLLGPNAVVVGVDVGKIGSKLAIHLEAVSSKTGESLFVTEVTSPVENWGDKVAVPIALFARQLVEKLAALALTSNPAPTVVVVPAPPRDTKVVVGDAPLAATLTPPPAPPPQPPPEVRSATPAAIKWTLGAGGVVAAGASVGFLVAGLGTRAQLNSKATMTPDGQQATGYTAAEAQALSGGSNSQFTISMVTAAVCAVLLATAAYFFLTE